jgi:lysophospholipase L1-like esterase
VSYKNFVKNILAVILGLSVSFLLLEGLIRIFEPVEFRVKANRIKLPRDKKYHLVNDKTGKLDEIIATSRNHLGFRGEMPTANFTGSLTIVAVGGSTTACEYISDGKTWCDLLGVKLGRKFKDVWENNAGLDGISSFGNLLLLEDFLIKIKPKILLFLLGANEQGLSDENFWDRGILAKNRDGLALWLAKLTRGSEVLDYAVNFYRYYKAKRIGLLNQIVDFKHLQPCNTSKERTDSLLQLHKKKYLPACARRLTRLIEVSRAHGMEPVFITQPMVFGEGIDPVTRIDLARVCPQNTDGKTLWQVLELYNQVVRDTAGEHGVLLIDLARKLPKTSAFFYDTYHFTNAGCAAVAEILAQVLEPFLAKKYPEFLNDH